MVTMSRLSRVAVRRSSSTRSTVDWSELWERAASRAARKMAAPPGHHQHPEQGEQDGDLHPRAPHR
jgi:hypothetical protein